MKFLTRFIAVCCGILIVAGCRGDENNRVVPGSNALDFRLNTLDHDRFYLNQHRKKVVVLVFWATWCKRCKEELVELKPFRDTFKPENLVIASVCTDPENINDVKEIVKSLKIDYPVLLDERAQLFRKYGLMGLPTTVVIDQKGIVRLIRAGSGPLIIKQLKSTIERLLGWDETIK